MFKVKSKKPERHYRRRSGVFDVTLFIFSSVSVLDIEQVIFGWARSLKHNPRFPPLTAELTTIKYLHSVFRYYNVLGL